jgi:hypothetical protein
MSATLLRLLMCLAFLTPTAGQTLAAFELSADACKTRCCSKKTSCCRRSGKQSVAISARPCLKCFAEPLIIAFDGPALASNPGTAQRLAISYFVLPSIPEGIHHPQPKAFARFERPPPQA